MTTFTETEWRMANPQRNDAETEAMRESAQRSLTEKDAEELSLTLDEAFTTTVTEQRKGYDGLSPWAASSWRKGRHS